MLICMSHDLYFFQFYQFPVYSWYKTKPFFLQFTAGTGKGKKRAIKLKSTVGTPLYNQRYLTCELSFLSCMTRKVNVVILNKILRILARSPINPWNIEHVPWPWSNNISICQVTQSVSCVWLEHLNAKSSAGLHWMREKIKLVKKKNLFHKNAKKFWPPKFNALWWPYYFNFR